LEETARKRKKEKISRRMRQLQFLKPNVATTTRRRQQRRQTPGFRLLVMLMLTVLVWAVTMIPVTSATFWSSASYIAGERVSLERRKRRLERRSQQEKEDASSNRKQVLEKRPAAVLATDKALEYQPEAQEEKPTRQHPTDGGGDEDAPVSAVAVAKVATPTSTTSTTRTVTTVSLSEPTTASLDTLPLASSRMSMFSNASSSDSSLLTENERQQQKQQQQQEEHQHQQPKVSPAGVTRYILVSTVLVLFSFNIHLYISL
jgi:hypothetical protein